MCHGFSHFSAILHYFVLAKLATSSIRVELLISKSHDRVVQPLGMVNGSRMAVWISNRKPMHIYQIDQF